MFDSSVLDQETLYSELTDRYKLRQPVEQGNLISRFIQPSIH